MNPSKVKILSSNIDILDWPSALERISKWAETRDSRYVCICNVHSVVTASRDAQYGQIVNDADMVTPDGAPVAWLMRRLGFPRQERINGPDLMWRYCQQAEQSGEAVFLYGGTQEILDRLRQRLAEQFPVLRIAGAYSPPFRALSEAEDEAVIEMINASGAGVVWVSLGCPKQEFWMSAHRGRIQAVMIGVGAAFDFLAGTTKRAPEWMQSAGLEWLHRLASEPRRLWRRYLVTNTLFVIAAGRQLLRAWIRCLSVTILNFEL